MSSPTKRANPSFSALRRAVGASVFLRSSSSNLVYSTCSALQRAACAFFECCSSRCWYLACSSRSFCSSLALRVVSRPSSSESKKSFCATNAPRWLRMREGLDDEKGVAPPERLPCSKGAHLRPPVFSATLFRSTRGASSTSY